ncbi:MAG TPA: tetratricopeptide repeat protein [Pyrinomonadaceae bacterium]|nr:tetratricopeptide repeat protein [Pyrinomonadaceae bacterium]
MSKQKIIFLVVGLVVGFLLGFFVNDSLNRKELDPLRAENARLKTEARSAAGGDAQGAQAATGEGPGGMPRITEEQARAAIERADANPSDANIQKMSGQVLFVYATQTNSPAMMPDAARILRRAHEADPKDFESMVLLGNALFIVARNGDPARLKEAREVYTKALEVSPDDPVVRTSLGLTYFYDKPSDPQRAIAEYRKTLAKDPQHEMTLQSMALALITLGRLDEAQQTIGELERAHPSNPQLANLSAQLAQKRNASKEKQ